MTGATRALAERRVFLDSSGFLALINRRDAYHREASAIWKRLAREHWTTATTNFVIAETHALFLARLGQPDATAFLRAIGQSSTETIRAGPRDALLDRAATARLYFRRARC